MSKQALNLKKYIYRIKIQHVSRCEITDVRPG